MRLQLGARGVWLPRDERDAVEWRRVQRARNEAPSDVDVLLAVRQSSRCTEAPERVIAHAAAGRVADIRTWLHALHTAASGSPACLLAFLLAWLLANFL